MKFSTALESQLNRLVVGAAGLGTVVLFLSVYISTIQTRDKAVNFIASNIQQISMAEIYSQSTNDIDREMRRLYEAWKGTQDVDLRAEVYIDGQLVGKAGQLGRFNWLSQSTSKTYDLPSGQKLLINVDLDLMRQIEFEAALLAVFGVFIYGAYLLLKRSLRRSVQSISSPIEERVEWLTVAAQSLPNSLREGHTFKESPIQELRALDSSLELFSKQILELEATVATESFNAGRVKMADLLAHSIKGTLALLRLGITNAKGLSELDRAQLLESLSQASSASQDLLASRRSMNQSLIGVSEKVQVEEVVSSVVEQITNSMDDGRAIKLSFENICVTPVETEIRRFELITVLANLIENAIDAIESQGDVSVRLAQLSSEAVEIRISDTGKGIAPDVLPLLMKEGATFDKQDGNGLGLFHAKQIVVARGGTVTLESKLGKGTTVIVRLPISISAVTTDTTIVLAEGQKLVVVDDDPCIHGVVEHLIGQENKDRVVHIHSAPQFEEWMQANGTGDFCDRVYWFDYDLKDKFSTGLDLIKSHGLQYESYLVTGMASDPELRLNAKDANVRLVSKDGIEKIKFDLKRVTPNVSQEMGFGT